MRIINKIQTTIIFDNKDQVLRSVSSGFPRPYTRIDPKNASTIQTIIHCALKDYLSECPIFRQYRILTNGYGQFKCIEFTDTDEELDCETVFKNWIDNQIFPLHIDVS